MNHLRVLALKAGGIAAVALVATDPAYAGVTVPGPVLGAGLPALGILAGGYYLIRRYRSR